MDVFVYGTLKKGKHNHTLMEDSSFVGEGVTSETFFMWDVGFPHVFEDKVYDCQPHAPVRGEVYSVNDEVLRNLDWLEGVPHHYDRRIVEVKVGDEVMSAYMYITQPDHVDRMPTIDEIEDNKRMVKDNTWVWT